MLKDLRDSSLVLTTHRMDEAESLCDQIAIMINGRFVCFGSPGQLKSLYGKGYSIQINHEPSQDIFPLLKTNLFFFQKLGQTTVEVFDQGSGEMRKVS